MCAGPSGPKSAPWASSRAPGDHRAAPWGTPGAPEGCHETPLGPRGQAEEGLYVLLQVPRNIDGFQKMLLWLTFRACFFPVNPDLNWVTQVHPTGRLGPGHSLRPVQIPFRTDFGSNFDPNQTWKRSKTAPGQTFINIYWPARWNARSD